MKLSELQAKGSLFAEIAKLMPLGFTAGREAVADATFYNMFGERLLLPKLQDMELSVIAELLVFKFGEKWTLSAVNLSSTDLGKSKQRVRNEVNSKYESNSGETNTTNNEAAFNSADMVTTDGSATANSGSNLIDGTVNINEHYYSIDKIYNDLSLIDKNNIMDLVFNDCKKFLTLSLY